MSDEFGRINSFIHSRHYDVLGFRALDQTKYNDLIVLDLELIVLQEMSAL